MNTTTSILNTSSARCRDCYRCVRACPVNAIGVMDNQAYVDQDRCILCGTCVRECPQGAKVYRDDIQKVKMQMENNKVVVSVAPSFAGVYGDWKGMRIPAALRKLGFYKVEETSIGADIVAQASTKMIDDNNCSGVCSACPAVVSYIEKYMPDNCHIIMPVMSPMLAHAKKIKSIYNNVKVVFIGPCIAKKKEAEREDTMGIVDAVLTFEELDNWLENEKVDLNTLPESSFDGVGTTNAAKLFALPGGMIETTGLNDSMTNASVLHTSGAKNVIMLLESALLSDELQVIEPLFCEGGCIGGPAISGVGNIFERRAAIMRYASINNNHKIVKVDEEELNIAVNYMANAPDNMSYTEQQIIEYYERTGKSSEQMRLDCGACGYGNCRENAIAVINGMAEKEMCLPYMRRLAEKRTDKILESSPNGIVILDENLRITSMNSSFKKFFTCSDSIIGRQISYLCDDKEYIQIGKSAKAHTDTVIKCYGKEFHQLTYYLLEENQYVGIYVDISDMVMNQEKLKAMRTKTLDQVKILLEHQVEMAQQLTMFLGENTAKSEALMEGLLQDEQE